MEIDIDKLSRNYSEKPLGKREWPCIEDMQYLYLELNLSNTQIAKYFNRCTAWSENINKKYNLKKSKDAIVANKIKQCQEEFGVTNYAQVPKYKEKQLATMQEKYGITSWFAQENWQQQRIDIMRKKYGDDYTKVYKSTKTPEAIEHGNEQRIKTMQEKYGVPHNMMVPEIAKKRYETIIKRYKVFPASKNEKVKQKAAAKQEETNKKILATKKANGSIGNRSKSANRCVAKLRELFEVITEMYSERYPFCIDAYIPRLDLFIEFNFFDMHGDFPYTGPECLQNKYWQDRINEKDEKPRAVKALETYTERDVRKRNWAREHHLNWIEFFSEKEFYVWFEEVLKKNLC